MCDKIEVQPPRCLVCPGPCKARDDRKKSRPRMELAILLSLAASFCTATSSICHAFMFSERLQTTPAALAAALPGLVVLAVGVWVLSRGDLITAHAAPRPAGTSGRLAERELTRRSWR